MEKKDLHQFLYFFNHNKTLNREQTMLRDRLLVRDCGGGEEASSHIATKKNASTEHRTGVDGIKYINPKDQQEILIAFNQDKILKYTCHLIDSIETVRDICMEIGSDTYDLEKHTLIIKERFDELISKYENEGKTLSQKMFALISTYIKGEYYSKGVIKKDNWSENNIRENWRSDELLAWGKEHPGIIPTPGNIVKKHQGSSGYSRLNQAYKDKRSGKRMLSFGELVLYFKRMFHIRQDNSVRMLTKKVNEDLIEKYKERLNISFSDRFYDSIELFTDVDKLLQAYKRIVEIIIENTKNDVVNIYLEFYNDISTKSVYFTIHDKDQLYGKSLLDTQRRIGTVQSDLIKNQINGLCDLYIDAEFEDGGKAEFNLWDSEKLGCTQLENNDFKGVKYILRF